MCCVIKASNQEKLKFKKGSFRIRRITSEQVHDGSKKRKKQLH